MSLLTTCLTTNKEGLASTLDFAKTVVSMYNDFGVELEITHNKEEQPDTYTVALEFDQQFENILKHARNIDYRYNHWHAKQARVATEYVFYVKHTMSKQENKGKTEFTVIEPESFTREYMERNGMLAVPVESIEEIPPEPVYDFETLSDNHSFIGNHFVTHNCIAETPEGIKVGLVKNLSMVGGITVMTLSQIHVIRNFWKANSSTFLIFQWTNLMSILKFF